MDYESLRPAKVRVGGVGAWRISWPDGRKVRMADFRLQREALDFRRDLDALAGQDPRLIPGSRWACDGEFTAPAPARAGILTSAELGRIRDQGPRDRYDESLVRLVVFSMESGIETITVDAADEQVAAGRHLMLLTPLDDIPAAFLSAWAKSQPAARAVTGYDGNPAHPAAKLLGEEEQPSEIDRILAEGYLSDDHFRFSPATLRMIAVARGLHDLRQLPAIPGEYSRHVDWLVVSRAMLTELRVGMFMPDDKNDAGDWRRRARGLPLGPLAGVQVYGSNLNGRWQGMSHNLWCQHHKEGWLSDADDMLPLQQFIRTYAGGMCSKCGGFSLRRPTASQLAYYLDMEALAGALKTAATAARSRHDRYVRGISDEEHAEIIAVLKKIDDAWCRPRYGGPLDEPAIERLTILTAEARRLAGQGRPARAPDGQSADVIPFPGAPA